MGTIDKANDISNADIIWFVVDYDLSADPVIIELVQLSPTTLERSEEGLVGGDPMPQSKFEEQILEKIRGKQPKKPRSKKRFSPDTLPL